MLIDQEQIDERRWRQVENRKYQLGQELRLTILATGKETDGRHDMIEAVQPPHSATPLHLHTRYEERMYVLDGELNVWAGDDQLTLRRGGFYTIGLNVPHMIKAGPEGARAIVVSSPAGFAELLERTATPAHLANSETKLDTELFVKVSTELGDVVLGPPGMTPAEAATPAGS